MTKGTYKTAVFFLVFITYTQNLYPLDYAIDIEFSVGDSVTLHPRPDYYNLSLKLKEGVLIIDDRVFEFYIWNIGVVTGLKNFGLSAIGLNLGVINVTKGVRFYIEPALFFKENRTNFGTSLGIGYSLLNIQIEFIADRNFPQINFTTYLTVPIGIIIWKLLWY